MNLRDRLARLARADVVALASFGVFFVAGLVWLFHPWQPVEDLAITELEVRRVIGDTQLSGAYSSLPFHHPGPLLFFYLWLPYKLFGEHSSGLLAATVWFNGAVLAVILATARRLGGKTLALVLAGATALWAGSQGLPRFLHPWNPYVGALPMVALVLLTWALVERRAWALPVVAALASWTLQAHVQFAPTIAALGAVGIVALMVRTARAEGRAGLWALRWPLAIAVGIVVLAWAPVVVDVVVHGSDSNPAAVIRHYRGPQSQTIDSSDVVRVLRSQLSVHPTWAHGPRPYSLFLSPVAILTPYALVVYALALAGVWARRAWIDLRGMAVAAIAFSVSVLALTRVTGQNLSSWYLISVEATSIVLDAVAIASLVSTIAWLVRTRVPRLALHPPRWAAGLLTVALVTVAAASLPRVHSEEVTASVADDMLPAVEDAIGTGRPVLLEARSGLGGWVQATLALQLEKRSYDVSARTTIPAKFPDSMSADPPDDAVRLVVVTNPPADAQWNDGVTLVAEQTYNLNPDGPRLHVVVLEAPLSMARLTGGP